jgi:hypothetical protein
MLIEPIRKAHANRLTFVRPEGTSEGPPTLPGFRRSIAAFCSQEPRMHNDG